MSCFAELYNSKFLKNIGFELTQARSAINSHKPMRPLGLYYAKKQDRKRLYQQYVDACDFKSYIVDIDAEDKDMLYALQEGPIVWLASRSNQIIKQSLQNSLLQTGDLPIYTGKQFIYSKLFYIAMYDLSFSVEPVTLN